MKQIGSIKTGIVKLDGRERPLQVRHLQDETGFEFYRCIIGEGMPYDIVKGTDGIWSDVEEGPSPMAGLFGRQIDKMNK